MSKIEFSWLTDKQKIKFPVYMGWEYQNLFAKIDGSKAHVLQCDIEGQITYLPMLIRDLGHGVKEAYSAYGYGGLWGESTLTDADVTALQQFLASESILAVFIRHSPFLENQKYWPVHMVEHNRKTYAVTLKMGDTFDAYLKAIPQKLRWSVNFARKADLQVIFHPLATCSSSRIKAFYQLYAALMQKKGTSDYYLFSEVFFLEHVAFLGDFCDLAEIIDPENGNLMAAAFFLKDKTGWVHYHLSAATRDAMKLQSMELLLAAAICRYGDMGYHAMHLGGGHALDECDGLSRFKSKFADCKLNFSCTKLICNQEGYQNERARKPLTKASFFLIEDARSH